MEKLKRKFEGLLVAIVITILGIVIYETFCSFGQLIVDANSSVEPMAVIAPEDEPFIKTSGYSTEAKTEMVEFVATINPSPTEVPTTNTSVTNQESHIGKKMFVPQGTGAIHPYMGWQLISDPTTPQFQLRMEAETYDENDFGKIDDRYAVAVKPYYGEIGDFIDIVQEDGLIIHCIIAEYKGDENKCDDKILSTYIHHDGSIVEFLVNQNAWYGAYPERTVYDYHPEWNVDIDAIYNIGNYWDR